MTGRARLLLLPLLSILPMVATNDTVASQESPPTDTSHSIMMDLRAGFCESGFREYSVGVGSSFILHKRIATQGRWLGFSLTTTDGKVNWGQRILVYYGSMMVMELLPPSEPELDSPLTAMTFLKLFPLSLVSALDSKLLFRLADPVSIGFGNSTEYLFWRGRDGEKGIYYTPSLVLSTGFTGTGTHGGPVTNGVQVSGGPTLLWSFEDKSRILGWTVTFSVYSVGFWR